MEENIPQTIDPSGYHWSLTSASTKTVKAYIRAPPRGAPVYWGSVGSQAGQVKRAPQSLLVLRPYQGS